MPSQSPCLVKWASFLKQATTRKVYLLNQSKLYTTYNKSERVSLLVNIEVVAIVQNLEL